MIVCGIEVDKQSGVAMKLVLQIHDPNFTLSETKLQFEMTYISFDSTTYINLIPMKIPWYVAD